MSHGKAILSRLAAVAARALGFVLSLSHMAYAKSTYLDNYAFPIDG